MTFIQVYLLTYIRLCFRQIKINNRKVWRTQIKQEYNFGLSEKNQIHISAMYSEVKPKTTTVQFSHRITKKNINVY